MSSNEWHTNVFGLLLQDVDGLIEKTAKLEDEEKRKEAEEEIRVILHARDTKHNRALDHLNPKKHRKCYSLLKKKMGLV